MSGGLKIDLYIDLAASEGLSELAHHQRAEVSDALSRVNKQHLTADSTPTPSPSHVLLSDDKAHLPDSMNRPHRGKGDQ